MSELEPDNIFLRELKKGHSWQLWVALQFLVEGFAVMVPCLGIRPDHRAIDEYTDRGDVVVILSGELYRFEVKSRNLAFNSVADYPYNTAFVERVNTWRRKRNKPAAVLLVSQASGAIIVVPTSSQQLWVQEEDFDSVRNYKRDYYKICTQYLKNWHDLILWLKQKHSEKDTFVQERLAFNYLVRR